MATGNIENLVNLDVCFWDMRTDRQDIQTRWSQYFAKTRKYNRLRLASTWVPSPPRRPTVTLTFNLKNLIRPSLGATGYLLPVSSSLFEPFIRYRGNKICPNEGTNGQTDGRTDRQPENAMPSPTRRVAKA